MAQMGSEQQNLHWSQSSLSLLKEEYSRAYTAKTLYRKCNVGIKKKAEFDADFESLKIFKKLMGKSDQQKSDRKMEPLTFITVCKGFRPITFLG